MHRSSETIAALATALAAAQVELTNPEKSLTATLPGNQREGSARTFRYAPLSSGLDIVRKTLGQHEIATVQTTAIDQTTKTVSLTTVLAHSSGEWIASDWPVCPLADLGTPHRMGAALTYARRYALFTLVGIAGEDDLDAPEIGNPHDEATKPKGSGNDQARVEASPGASFVRRRPMSVAAKAVLEPAKSAALRDQLLDELAALASSGEGGDLGTGRSGEEKHPHRRRCRAHRGGIPIAIDGPRG